MAPRSVLWAVVLMSKEAWAAHPKLHPHLHGASEASDDPADIASRGEHQGLHKLAKHARTTHSHLTEEPEEEAVMEDRPDLKAHKEVGLAKLKLLIRKDEFHVPHKYQSHESRVPKKHDDAMLDEDEDDSSVAFQDLDDVDVEDVYMDEDEVDADRLTHAKRVKHLAENAAADTSGLTIPTWLLTTCGSKSYATHTLANLKKCHSKMSDTMVAAMDDTQGFCMNRGHPELPAITVKNGGTSFNLPAVTTCSASNTCNYIKTRMETNYKETVTTFLTHDQYKIDLAQTGNAPGLYGDNVRMRASTMTPLYQFTGDMAKANPPTGPFINMNQMWKNSDDSQKIWAAMCPLTEIDEEKVQDDQRTVCEFLEFIKNKQIKLLISLAPSNKEVGTSTSAPGCVDYMYLRKGMGATPSGAKDPVASCIDDVTGPSATTTTGQKVLWTSEGKGITALDSGVTSGSKAEVLKRTYTYKTHEFTQIYFNGWPDAAHATGVPPSPITAAIEEIIRQGARDKYKKVLVHCLGGRGRTGTVIAGIISKWKWPSSTKKVWSTNEDGTPNVQETQIDFTPTDHPTTAELVQIIVDLRARRFDMVEAYVQFEQLGKIFAASTGATSTGDASAKCTINEVIG